nr:hypothetical protein [Tanacetum cinerariifolium]
MIDYALWEVIENGATLPKTQVMEGVMTEMPITSVEEKAQRRLDVKARSTLMMGIPNEHQLKFNSIKDAKKLLEAVEKRFGGNAATKKTQRNLLKQQYENFTASSSETLDQTFDRLQKLMSQLELLGEKLSQEDDLEQIYPDDMEEIDLRWQMALLTMRAKKFLKKNERKLTVNGNETISFDKSKVECYNFHKREHFARECRALRNQDNKQEESSRRSVPVETPASTALVSCDGLGGYDWSDQAEEGPNYALMAFSSLSYDSKGNFMPPTPGLSYTGLDEFVNKAVAEAKSSDEEPKVVRKNDNALIIKEWVSDNASIIEEWVLDNEEEDVSLPKIKKKTVKPSIAKIEIVKSKQQEKTARKTVKQVEQNRQNTHNPRGNQRN